LFKTNNLLSLSLKRDVSPSKPKLQPFHISHFPLRSFVHVFAEHSHSATQPEGREKVFNIPTVRLLSVLNKFQIHQRSNHPMEFQHEFELNQSLDSCPAWLRDLDPETGTWKSLQVDANLDERSNITSSFTPIFFTDFSGNSAHIHDDDRFEVLPDLADSSTDFSQDDAMPATSQLAPSQTTNTQSNIVKPQPRWYKPFLIEKWANLQETTQSQTN
jgi:hypothetical protein